MPEDTGIPATMGQTGLHQLFMYERPARRWELLVRILYWILIGLILMIYGIVAYICLFIQWFVILFLGRRSQGLSVFIQGYLEYYVYTMPYMFYMTDSRPRITPPVVRIYREGPIEGT